MALNWRSLIQKGINKSLAPFNLEIQRPTHSQPEYKPGPLDSSTATSQLQLLLLYRALFAMKLPLPTWSETGFRVYSQNDEDGLLLFLFALIGTTNKMCVEVASGTPFGANATNLICNWAWSGLLIDGNENAVQQTKQFYGSHKDTWIFPPKVVNEWITAENINDLMKDNGASGEIDLFLLDLDGIDYWIWKSLKEVQPRVVVVEYMNIWDASKSVTVPYRPDFNRFDTHPDYFGASLGAFVKLGHEKGYRLVGCNRYSFNAFFVRNGIAEALFPEVSVDRCLQHPITKWGIKTRLPDVVNFEWVEV